MAYINTPFFKIRISESSKKRQGLKVGDVVRRHYTDGDRTVYSVMIVTQTGDEDILLPDGNTACSSYFIGALTEGDEPADGQLLDFVRIGNLFDEERAGALYLTSSGECAPYMDVIEQTPGTESLCYPQGLTEGDTSLPNSYCLTGRDYIESEYRGAEEGVNRILRITRNAISLPEGVRLGLLQTIKGGIKAGGMLVVSFKIRSIQPLTGIGWSFGYTDGRENDATGVFDVSDIWQYKVLLLSIDFPEQYERCFSIDLSGISEGEWCEIAEMNILPYSAASSLGKSVKGRIGKITGIVDPLFGRLQGYGAYFQNLYATHDVNIAGTLSAGDRDGQGSTFYAGRIHKNVLKNSLKGNFNAPVVTLSDVDSPAGAGDVFRLGKGGHTLSCQSAGWGSAHTGETYCFSFWARGDNAEIIIRYGGKEIGCVAVITEWNRYSAFLEISGGAVVDINVWCSKDVQFSAPQLEKGRTPTLYQPTDEVLNDTDEYGAWFSRGGIGGTIQNPLLKLNADGSISSRDGSFVINPDGTGHFAGGRFEWTKESILLKDFAIKWEDLDQQARDNLKPRSVRLSGESVFRYADELLCRCEPERVMVFATENNFSAQTREWFYKGSDDGWHKIQNGVTDTLTVLPHGHYWEGRNILPVKYVARYDTESYEDIFTIFKQFDGSDAYSVSVISSAGTAFRNNMVSTVLTASVLKGGVDVTGIIPEQNFRWTKADADGSPDEEWNRADHRGKSIEISSDEVNRKAVFECYVTISTEIESTNNT